MMPNIPLEEPHGKGSASQVFGGASSEVFPEESHGMSSRCGSSTFSLKSNIAKPRNSNESDIKDSTPDRFDILPRNFFAVRHSSEGHHGMGSDNQGYG